MLFVCSREVALAVYIERRMPYLFYNLKRNLDALVEGGGGGEGVVFSETPKWSKVMPPLRPLFSSYADDAVSLLSA